MREIQPVDSARTLDSLGDMLEAADDDRHLAKGWVDLSEALYIIEVAKRAEDREEWFPRGKWATIQAIQGRVEKELNKLWECQNH